MPGKPDYTTSVDIIAQTLAQIAIDLAKQSIGVSDQAQWRAEQADDVDLFGSQLNPTSFTSYDLISRSVSAGKTLFITEMVVGCFPDSATGDVSASAYGNLNSTVKGNVVFLRNTRSFAIVFNKPKVFAGADTVKLTAHAEASLGTNGVLAGHLGGWEE